jgi:hypothetical protein
MQNFLEQIQKEMGFDLDHHGSQVSICLKIM